LIPSNRTTGPVFIIGDVHGEREKLVSLLRCYELMDGDLKWTGRDCTLWFTGDFFDRGPDGIGTTDLVMTLQRQAAAARGRVSSLLGNHEVLILAAYRFGTARTTWGDTFINAWKSNGGSNVDIDSLTDRHIQWICDLPAMALESGRLLIHADTTFYSNYGRTIDHVNRAVSTMLNSDFAPAWNRLLEEFSERRQFEGNAKGTARAADLLQTFGGRQIIHGHTPISIVTKSRPETVTAPFTYADALCINVDGALCQGGPGFIYRLPEK
jgi:hypothetical protein